MVHTGLIFRQIDYFCTSHLTGVAQLVEHRSPKPSVGRSSRSSRASRIIAAFFVPDPKGLCSYVPQGFSCFVFLVAYGAKHSEISFSLQ